jgi:hypothetical protein
LHDVSYVETDNVKKLRNRLKRFLDRLDRGKFGDDELSLTGSTRKARAREHARLRNEWPQVIPDHLKRKLLANFNLEISSTALATFVCASCVENCPIDDKVALPFEDFDMNSLKRPDEFIDIRAEDSEMSGEKTDEIVPDDLHPWPDSRCSDPPMPRPDNSPYHSLLVDQCSLEQDTETLEPALAVCRKCRSDLKAGRAIETIFVPYLLNFRI